MFELVSCSSCKADASGDWFLRSVFRVSESIPMQRLESEGQIYPGKLPMLLEKAEKEETKIRTG
jgi:hypothetical protein